MKRRSARTAERRWRPAVRSARSAERGQRRNKQEYERGAVDWYALSTAPFRHSGGKRT